MNRADLMYAALKDGRPKTRRDLFDHAGRFYLSNNAASELRGRGVEVVQWRADGQYVYQILPPLAEEGNTFGPSSSGPSSASGTAGSASLSPSLEAELLVHRPTLCPWEVA